MEHGKWLRIALILACMLKRICGQANAQSVAHQCNSTIRDGEGILISPNFPQLYPSNIYCQWQITVEENRNIQLSFSHFELETTSGCSYDQVMVFNGPSKSHPLLGKFCGSFRPADVITTSNRMLMTFQSDDSNERTGFLAVFISIAPRIADFDSCGGLLTESSGTFHSVNFPKFNYPNSMTCVWLIRAPENHQIVLTFSKMTLEISTNCKYDSVTVLSGWSRRSHTKVLGRFCKDDDIPDEIVSTGNQMFVTFASDSSGNDVGFSASYKIQMASLSTTSSSDTTTANVESTTSLTLPPSTTFSIASSTINSTQTTANPCTASCTIPVSISSQACSARFVAYVKVLNQRTIDSGVIRVRVQLIRMLKLDIEDTPSKRKTKFWMDVSCPACFPNLTKRSRYIFAGNELEPAGGQIYPSDYIELFSKSILKTWKREIRRCRKKSGSKKHDHAKLKPGN